MDDKLGSPYSYRAFSISQYEDLDSERHLESGIFDRNGQLYLTFHDWPGLQPDAPVYYQLNWSEGNQWFGYEYLGTIRLRDGRTK